MKRAGLEPAAYWRVSHRARAEPCRYLVRSTSAGSVTQRIVERSEPYPGGSRGELARSIGVADIRFTIFCLTPRLKTFANLNGWIAR